MQLSFMTRVLAPAAAAVCLATAPARAQDAPPAQNPCADSLYQSLKGKPLDALSEREYQYFIGRDKACTDYQRLAALVDRPANAAPPQRDLRLQTDSRTQASTFGEGVDVYIRNDSPVPIIVNSVRVFDCENIRHSSCATHHPQTRIPPNQERRVLTIRYQPESNMPSRYRLEYLVSPAEQ
ncbi:MAG TPA: hypothetical protein VFQ45_23065 [Longimicrobium sp.]|nr:hypothetical protein [Longimicrobium sp.]